MLFSVPADANDCTLSLSQSQIELGALRPGSISWVPGQPDLFLGTRRLSLNIACPWPTSMLLRFDGPAAGPQAFRFDRQGRFTVGLSNARLDGKPVSLAAAQRPNEAAASHLMAPGQSLVVLARDRPAKGRFFLGTGRDRHAPAGQCDPGARRDVGRRSRTFRAALGRIKARALLIHLNKSAAYPVHAGKGQLGVDFSEWLQHCLRAHP
ncbi:hypothetical protein QNM99_05015 [Pseudomonas sp. PCH446]